MLMDELGWSQSQRDGIAGGVLRPPNRSLQNVFSRAVVRKDRSKYEERKVGAERRVLL